METPGKMPTQSTLKWLPKARLPENPRLGAVVSLDPEEFLDARDPKGKGRAHDPPQATISQSSTSLPINIPADKAKKRRRDLSLKMKNDILRYKASHSIAETLQKFPETSRSALRRMKIAEKLIRKAVERGKGKEKRKSQLYKYRALGEHLFKFFEAIRDAQGSVSRGLLEEYVLTLPEDTQLDLMEGRDKRRDEFFARWKRQYNLVYRNISGTTQFLPADYDEKVTKFKALLRSMYEAKKYTHFICGDETGVRFEEIAPRTLAVRGSKKVPIRTTGGERSMYTVFLASQVQLDNNGQVVITKKYPPQVIFKGL
jgi:hypothetical protein